MHPSYPYEIAAFFSFYRGIFATQKSKPLFFSASTALAPAVRPDDGCDGVIFRGGRCEAHDPYCPRGGRLLRLRFCLGVGRGVSSVSLNPKDPKPMCKSHMPCDVFDALALHRIESFLLSELLSSGSPDLALIEGLVILSREVDRKLGQALKVDQDPAVG